MVQTIIILTITIGLAIAVGVWVILKRSLDTRPVEPDSIGDLNRGAKKRRSMEIGDWSSSAFNVFLGVLVGVFIHSLAELLATGFWPLAIAIPLIFAVVFFLEWVADKLVDKIFPSGIRPARHPKPQGRKPLPRLLSLPTGMGIGVVLVQLGFGDQILDLIP